MSLLVTRSRHFLWKIDIWEADVHAKWRDGGVRPILLPRPRQIKQVCTGGALAIWTPSQRFRPFRKRCLSLGAEHHAARAGNRLPQIFLRSMPCDWMVSKAARLTQLVQQRLWPALANKHPTALSTDPIRL